MGSTSSLRKSISAKANPAPERAIPKPGHGLPGVIRHATEAPPPEMAIPVVRPGEVVLWYSDGSRNSTPHNALVAAIETNSLCLDLITAGGFRRLNSVLWIEDPRLSLGGRRRFGGWELGGASQKMAEQKDEIAELSDRIHKLEELVDQLCQEKQ